MEKKECVQKSKKKFLIKTGQLGLPQKGQKQVYDLQCNALTSLINFVQLHSKVDLGCKCMALEVIHLFLSILWQSQLLCFYYKTSSLLVSYSDLLYTKQLTSNVNHARQLTIGCSVHYNQTLISLPIHCMSDHN